MFASLDIVLFIMPLLRNGVAPEKQTILPVPQAIAEPVATGGLRRAIAYESPYPAAFGVLARLGGSPGRG
jgi:hypothetical protein